MYSHNINICLSCDENYVKYAGVVIASILTNAKCEDNLHFYILDGGISNESKDKLFLLKSIKDCHINFVEVNENDFEDYKRIQTHQYISLAACYRLKIASLLFDVDKIIYLDCDVIVNSSLRDLFNINLQDKVIAGVLDIDIKRKNRNANYINSGVLLMNLDKIRKCNIEEEFLVYTQQNISNITMGDQEIINNVLEGRILNIDEKYNVQSECYIRRSSFTKSPTVIHFIGPQKPWHWASWSVHKDLYFKYLQMTPWSLTRKELFKWTRLNKTLSFISWFKHRPVYYLQSKFWKAVKNDYLTQDSPKVFVVILLACFGDVILCNSLFQNIKRLYPNSKTIFVVDKPWLNVAKYQKDVDEVVIFDKRGINKGLIGLLKFIMNFPYKKIDYIFKIYDNFRVDILSLLLNPKKIVGKPYDSTAKVQERHSKLLKSITKENIISYPITYIATDDIPKHLIDMIKKDKKYIGLCATSKLEEKDMPLEVAEELVNYLNNSGFEVLFFGTGEKSVNYAQKLISKGCRFINLVDKTTIYQLAQVLKNCRALVSVDTGTMHFGYANGVKTICIFNNDDYIRYWAPDKKIYPFTFVITKDSLDEEIYKLFEKFSEEE